MYEHRPFCCQAYPNLRLRTNLAEVVVVSPALRAVKGDLGEGTEGEGIRASEEEFRQEWQLRLWNHSNLSELGNAAGKTESVESKAIRQCF